MTPEEQRREEDEALERERKAFRRHQDAWINMQRQFLPIGNGQPTPESIDEFDSAELEWRAAQREVTRIAEEIRSGSRR